MNDKQNELIQIMVKLRYMWKRIWTFGPTRIRTRFEGWVRLSLTYDV